ncbi:MAG: serine/threonine-protein kinase, partial [Myxococcota bacterium]
QRDRFVREARAVNRINHENIVEITDFGEAPDGLVYLVMEYVPGPSLQSVAAEGPMSVGRALRICAQVGEALARAHEMGVIHRDLKPSNILLTPDKHGAESVKVLDFGIAKILDAPSLTASHQLFGTPGYIAPEYIRSAEIDGRADLYSLGVMLYELLTGELPFDYEYPGDVLVKHVTEPPVDPRDRIKLEDGAAEFVLRCLRKDPDERFRDAYHFIDEIRALSERMGGDDSWASLEVEDELEPEGSREAPKTIPAPMAIPMAPSAVVPEAGKNNGPAGALRWRERFDALDVLARNDDGRVEDPALEAALEQARTGLADLERSVAEVAKAHTQLDALAKEARDYRTTLGRAIDRVARRQSEARGKRGALEARRATTTAARREAGDEGEADAMLWELASIDEGLRTVLGTLALGEVKLRELRGELMRRNDETDAARRDALIHSEEGMVRCDALASALRAPLDEAEAIVRARWE